MNADLTIREIPAIDRGVQVLLANLMEDLESRIRAQLDRPAHVRDSVVFPDVKALRIGDDWVRMNDVVAVVADLKGSTNLSLGRYVNTTVRLYESATGGGVKVASCFKPVFTDIQGDGFFCLFHGDGAYSKAMAAAMSLAYYSKEILEPAIKKVVHDSRARTGLKVGVAAGRLAVGRLGVGSMTELIWPGKPVNWAFKCSGAADRHQVIVTQRVFERVIDSNEYFLRPCYIPGHGHGLRMWSPVPVDSLPGVKCHVRKIPWCPEVADEFANPHLREKLSNMQAIGNGRDII